MPPFHEVVIVGGGGQWIAPRGVTEVRRMGLLDVLRGAGGHHVTRLHGFAIMAGPETLPPEAFTPEHRARVLESA